MLFLPTFGVCLWHFSYALSPAFRGIDFCVRGAVHIGMTTSCRNNSNLFSLTRSPSLSCIILYQHANELIYHLSLQVTSAYLPFSLTFSIFCLCFCCNSQCAVAVFLNITSFCSSRGCSFTACAVVVTSEAKRKNHVRYHSQSPKQFERFFS